MSDKAKAVVSKADKEASAMTVDKIVIDGYADRAGGEDYNVKLSGRRADRLAGWFGAGVLALQNFHPPAR